MVRGGLLSGCVWPCRFPGCVVLTARRDMRLRDEEHGDDAIKVAFELLDDLEAGDAPNNGCGGLCRRARYCGVCYERWGKIHETTVTLSLKNKPDTFIMHIHRHICTHTEHIAIWRKRQGADRASVSLDPAGLYKQRRSGSR